MVADLPAGLFADHIQREMTLLCRLHGLRLYYSQQITLMNLARFHLDSPIQLQMVRPMAKIWYKGQQSYEVEER